jgi:K+-transporting ATPase ATPase A chain
MAALSEHLSFNTAASFTTNTNWQNYGGEKHDVLSLADGRPREPYFLSAAVGIAIAAAFVRGIARHTSRTIGNFWVDVTRITYYLLLPICIIYAIVLVSQGIIQNFKPYDTVTLTGPIHCPGAGKR